MVSFVPRGRQINATRNQTRINIVSYQRRNQFLILEFTVRSLVDCISYTFYVSFSPEGLSSSIKT